MKGNFNHNNFKALTAVLDFQKKILGPAGPQVFIFCRQNKYSGRQKLYLRINGFSFVKDNGLSLVYVFPKKKVTYLGGQVGDQAWKLGCHWVKAGRIGNPTGRNVEPWLTGVAKNDSQLLSTKHCAPCHIGPPNEWQHFWLDS